MLHGSLHNYQEFRRLSRHIGMMSMSDLKCFDEVEQNYFDEDLVQSIKANE